MIIINARLPFQDKISSPKYIVTDSEDIITEIGDMQNFKYLSDTVFDIKNQILLPNFIDPHIHGAFGYDCLDVIQNPKAIKEIAKNLSKINVGAFVPTIMTQSYSNMSKSAKIISKMIDIPYSSNCADIIGINVEGPFINQARRGAHLPEYICEPDINFITNLQKECNGHIKLVTYAIELDPEFKFLKALKDLNIIPSVGHTTANAVQLENAIKNGLCSITHLNNAMEKIRPKTISPTFDTALLSEKSLFSDIYIELISDGYHVDKKTINTINKYKNAQKIILISDSTRASGMPDGKYELGGQNFTKKGDECRLQDGTLAGSALQLPNALNNYMKFTGETLLNVLPMLTSNTAKLLNISNLYGDFQIGKRFKILQNNIFTNITKEL